MRVKFGTTFNKIQDAIEETSVTLEKLKTFLRDCYPDLSPQLGRTSSNTLDDILEIVKEKCTLIDIGILKAIAKRFTITKADVYIKAYEDVIERVLSYSYNTSKPPGISCGVQQFSSQM